VASDSQRASPIPLVLALCASTGAAALTFPTLRATRSMAGRAVVFSLSALAAAAALAALAGLAAALRGRDTPRPDPAAAPPGPVEPPGAGDGPERRAELASLAAHELRGPLMTIKGLASTGERLSDGLSDEERRRLFGSIDAEVSRLGGILEHTATALLADAGRIRYLPRPEPLAGVVEDAVSHAALTSHPVVVEVEPGLSARCDRERIREVIGELLENAAKFSPPDRPVEVRAYRRDGDAVVEVADHGPGIAPGEREGLLRSFVRRRPRGYEGVPGAGLGLFVSRLHVEAQGGRLWLDGRADGPETAATGTVVRFTLPLEEGSP
jgi:signal transduction histidine kinase